MLLNKTHHLKKIKNNFNNIISYIENFNSEIYALKEKISLLEKDNKIKSDLIRNIQEKNILLEKDISNIVYSVSVLNLVVENIIYGEEDILDFKNKIKYH